MKKKGYKGRCEKRSLPKCQGVCKTYDAIQYAYADILQSDSTIQEFRCNVILNGLSEGEYTTDFVCIKVSGELMVKECVFRKYLTKPMTVKLLDVSREYWLKRGADWGIVTDAENDILKCGDSIFRVLDIKNNEIFLIDCGKRTIPTWISEDEIQDCTYLTEKELKEYIPIPLPDFDTMDAKSLCIINERYTLISDILPFVSDFRMRNKRIAAISAEYGICRQTIINYLCLYLAFQDKAVLAPKPCISDTTLSHDEKNLDGQSINFI